MTTKTRLTDNELDDLSYSDEYQEYIMDHYDGTRVICNGDTMILAMEAGYLWKEFLASKNIEA